MKRITLIFLILNFLCSCSSVKLFNVKPDFIEPDYKIGLTQTKNVGEDMITLVSAISYPAFIATEDFNIPPWGNWKILLSSQWICYERTENGDYFCSGQLEGSKVGECCLFIKPSGEIYGFRACNGGIMNQWKPRAMAKPTKSYKKGASKQEIIYNGKSKDTIKLTYREYENDFARPAFFQELSYDFSESKIIGFRGMKIEVVEATNSAITFVIRTKMQ